MNKLTAKKIAHELNLRTDLNISACFDKDGNLLPYKPGDNLLSHYIAHTLVQYTDAEAHDEYSDDVINSFAVDIETLQQINQILNYDTLMEGILWQKHDSSSVDEEQL